MARFASRPTSRLVQAWHVLRAVPFVLAENLVWHMLQAVPPFTLAEDRVWHVLQAPPATHAILYPLRA